MALKVFKDICNNLRETWPDIVNVAIYHRLGNVPVSEASVVIAISSPHRQTALSAVEHAINKLKEMAPIWKKEEYAPGTHTDAQWKENSELPPPKQEHLSELDPSMIQINSSHEEVFSNIKAFMAYRKKMNNKDNMKTYCLRKAEERPEYSCCRVDAVGRRVISTQAEIQYRKEHYDETPGTDCNSNSGKTKTKRSASSKEASSRQLIQGQCRQSNTTGSDSPDTQRHLLQQSTTTPVTHDDPNIPFGISERLSLIEHHVGIKPSGPNGDLYVRLKQIEDKIIQIEDDCEEYLRQKNYFRKYEPLSNLTCPVISSHDRKTQHVKPRVFSIEDIDEKLMYLKSQLSLAGNDDQSGDSDS
ncbi:molybdopterin synthase catalytic subunit-like isoform X1 [Diaphorina citri]|uniref:Molybdopterin synthase catalytic subunit-like isoform X1 n=1 Tax=Diaphorina citri TaxID=121845 RepID=A0A1S4EA03_DIACI|nr:molybdopterin synthase catalytic subunit-like isoform X1 [Diaphorina citri]